MQIYEDNFCELFVPSINLNIHLLEERKNIYIYAHWISNDEINSMLTLKKALTIWEIKIFLAKYI